jgi:hypothetical protein
MVTGGTPSRVVHSRCGCLLPVLFCLLCDTHQGRPVLRASKGLKVRHYSTGFWDGTALGH